MTEQVEGEGALLEVRGLTVSAGARSILRAVSLRLEARSSWAVVGPSGVGKSTLLRCFNRLVDLTPALRVEGEIRFRGVSVRGADVDVDALRARMGFLFQQPVVFPRSIRENVWFGARRVRGLGRGALEALVERVLVAAGLWEEVKDRLAEPAARLSVGQQQRLCLARALAMEPEVLLLDEPTSALDAHSRALVEDSLQRLRGVCPLVLVTHDLEQARRLTDGMACFERRGDAGELVRFERW
ncbi:MAG: ATP-binding cassette domain-containing protein [Verrucomicrobiales bacterium]|nr:ATP-binding cassette domain-containing protein [Verrucomicrobiales bacterium]